MCTTTARSACSGGSNGTSRQPRWWSPMSESSCHSQLGICPTDNENIIACVPFAQMGPAAVSSMRSSLDGPNAACAGFSDSRGLSRYSPMSECVHQDTWQISCLPTGRCEAGTCAKRLLYGREAYPVRTWLSSWNCAIHTYTQCCSSLAVFICAPSSKMPGNQHILEGQSRLLSAAMH